MEKYGFVYIWRDRKHKRYYIGCHWGTENDGYICSSSWMLQAYKKRPNDFKRKILKKVYSNRKNLLEEEYRWLSFIKTDELKNKYYNLCNKRFGYFDDERLDKIKKTISERTKEAMNSPEVRKKFLEGLKTRNTRSSDPEVRSKRSSSMKGKNKIKTPAQLKVAQDAAKNRIGIPLSEEHKNKIAMAGSFNKINSIKIKCNHCDFEGNKGNIARYHNDRCKYKILCC